MLKGNDLGEDIQTWLDEMSLGTYEVVPVFNIEKIEDTKEDKFLLKIFAKNKKTNEIFSLEDLNDADKTIIEKQINWATKYIEDLEDTTLELDLSAFTK